MPTSSYRSMSKFKEDDIVKKIIALSLALIISFSFAKTTTFAEAFPNTAKYGQVNEDTEEREWDWMGVIGLLGLLGLRRKNPTPNK